MGGGVAAKMPLSTGAPVERITPQIHLINTMKTHDFFVLIKLEFTPDF